MSSSTWTVARNLGILVAVVFWLVSGFWVFKDARRRIADRWLVGMATLLGLPLPFFGPFVSLFLRPPEYLEDVRERELEIRVIEERLRLRSLECPLCRAAVEASYL